MPRLTETTFRRLFIATVVVQGIHVFEHVVQLYQVFVLGIPENQALGLLGYVLQFHGTEEWLHLVFNLSYLSALVLLLVTILGFVPDPVSRGAFAAFVFAVAFESWHNVEHLVIISNVIANGGCPCPGIGDVVLGTSDTV